MKQAAKKLTREQLKRMETLSADKPGLMEYAHHAGSFSITKLDSDEMKSLALKTMHEQTEMQLGQIFEQVELLARQAQKIKDRADISRRVYRAKIGFKPLPGNTYFLYGNPERRQENLSMIAPDEWGSARTSDFIAAVKLLADHTWTIVDSKVTR